MDAVADDPHHDGINEWGILKGVLYIRPKFPKHVSTLRKWVKVKRISYTPKRILVIAKMLGENA